MSNLRDKIQYDEEYDEFKEVFAFIMILFAIVALLFICSVCTIGFVTFIFKDTTGGRKLNKHIRIVVDKHD